MISKILTSWCCIALLSDFGPIAFAANDLSMMATIGPVEFATVAPLSTTQRTVNVSRFKLDVMPVTNAQFLAFVKQQPEWQRTHVSKLFADAGYLKHWPADNNVRTDQLRQPVVHISWFAATAYCEARGARLPRWYEWEAAAAAGPDRADARDDPQWRQEILNWYSRSSGSERLHEVGAHETNFYGVKDLHGLIWEWVEDYNGLLVSTDNREQGGADTLQFCGAGALSMEQKENYAILMRIAMLSSLEARYTTRNLGFRCVQDI